MAKLLIGHWCFINERYTGKVNENQPEVILVLTGVKGSFTWIQWWTVGWAAVASELWPQQHFPKAPACCGEALACLETPWLRSYSKRRGILLIYYMKEILKANKSQLLPNMDYEYNNWDCGLTFRHSRKRLIPLQLRNIWQLSGVSSVMFHRALQENSITWSHWEKTNT